MHPVVLVMGAAVFGIVLVVLGILKQERESANISTWNLKYSLLSHFLVWGGALILIGTFISGLALVPKRQDPVKVRLSQAYNVPMERVMFGDKSSVCIAYKDAICKSWRTKYYIMDEAKQKPVAEGTVDYDDGDNVIINN